MLLCCVCFLVFVFIDYSFVCFTLLFSCVFVCVSYFFFNLVLYVLICVLMFFVILF